MTIKLPADSVRIAALSGLPMAGALLGGWFDERDHLGYTTWRTACRSAGLNLSTLVDFTCQLLPQALLGLLTVGLALLVYGALAPDRHARLCVAAHAGCALSLPVGLILCAVLTPAVMLALDALLATLCAAFVLALMRRASQPAGLHP